MSSALESSVTLEDVFAVVAAKRVPLAPELAGYLALEIAEATEAAGGEIDPRSVYIGEEGTVALVRPKRDAASGDAEASIRAALARLLDASGAQTPALAGVARRRSGGGLAALVEELEAALIPVNRAAGRRALARLAREAKRVTLGVGRNASTSGSERPALRPSAPALAPSPPLLPDPLPEPPTQPLPTAALASSSPPPPLPPPLPPPVPPPVRTAPPQAIVSPASPTASSSQPPVPEDVLEPLKRLGPSRPPRASVSEVDNLIASFAVSGESDQSMRRELKALVGLEPTPPPPQPPQREHKEADVEALLALSDPSKAPVGPKPGPGAPASVPPAGPPHIHISSNPPTPAETPHARASRPNIPALAAPPAVARAQAPAVLAPPPASAPRLPASQPRLPERQAPTGPSALRDARVSIGKGRTPVFLILIAVVVLAGGGAAIWQLGLKQGLFADHTKDRLAAEQRKQDEERASAEAANRAARCTATLVVTDVPANAEVLLREGQAPIDIERMPVGPRLEFVATAEGFAPKRTVVPAGDTWDLGADHKPRYELAVQLEPTKVKPGQADLWPAGEPGSTVGGDGPPGTVHLVARPRGAEIWLLVAVGPEATIQKLKCASDVDVLMAGPTTFRKRLHVGASQFVEAQSAGTGAGAPLQTARVSAK